MSSFFKSTTTYDPLKRLLNADTDEERDKLTDRWKQNKLQELNFVGIVGGLLAGMLSGTGSWPSILANGSRQPWTVRACWYIGILFALSSVIVALQQSIRLYRLSSNPHPGRVLRRLLSCRYPDADGTILPRQSHVIVWQAGVFFLTLSAVAMLTGMFILIWSSTGGGGLTGDESWWNGEAKLAVAFTAIAVVIGVGFVYEQIVLYSWHGKDDSEECQ